MPGGEPGASRAAAVVVHDRRRGGVDGPPSGGPEPVGQVRLFSVHEVALVQRRRVGQRALAHHHEAAHDAVDVAGLVPHAEPVAVPVEEARAREQLCEVRRVHQDREEAGEPKTAALIGPVGILQPASDRGHVGVLVQIVGGAGEPDLDPGHRLGAIPRAGREADLLDRPVVHRDRALQLAGP